ncbi:MAG: hypothetical protein AB1489_38375 [Acidobacteriota bacterium]
MKIKPMIGEYEIPGIERIGTIENRCLVEVPVPGLQGSYHQNLGSGPISIRIEGSLAGDEARDTFLSEIRDKFNSGEPIDFVADITTATEIVQVLIRELKVTEAAGSTDTFCYAMTLTQYVEPPSMDLGADLGFGDLADVDLGIDLEALELLDLLELPDLLSVPNFGDPTVPLKSILDGVKTTLGALAQPAQAMKDIFGE